MANEMGPVWRGLLLGIIAAIAVEESRTLHLLGRFKPPPRPPTQAELEEALKAQLREYFRTNSQEQLDSSSSRAEYCTNAVNGAWGIVSDVSDKIECALYADEGPITDWFECHEVRVRVGTNVIALQLDGFVVHH